MILLFLAAAGVAVPPSDLPAAALQEAASDTTVGGKDAAAADTIEGAPASVVRVGAGRSTIGGRVVADASSEPVASALVTLERLEGPRAGRFRTETDDRGRFRFQGLPSGEYVLATHHIGYRDRTDTLAVRNRAVLDVDVPVTTRALELRPLRVEVRSAWLARTGFYSRKERGLGKFMTPEQVSRRSAHSVSQLMRGIQGVEVVRACDGGGRPCPKMLRMRHTNGFRSCRVEYFMDGQPMAGRVFPDDISAQDIAAVEIYRNISEMPARFYGRCGSVVLWGKRFDPRSEGR